MWIDVLYLCSIILILILTLAFCRCGLMREEIKWIFLSLPKMVSIFNHLRLVFVPKMVHTSLSSEVCICPHDGHYCLSVELVFVPKMVNISHPLN